MEAPDFWDDVDEANKITKKSKPVEAKLSAYHKLKQAAEDAETLMEMAEEEEDDSLEGEIREAVEEVCQMAEQFRLEALLKGEYDSHSAIISLHAGAGGTEAQDWNSMLYRMCICTGRKSMAFPARFSIISTARRRASRA